MNEYKKVFKKNQRGFNNTDFNCINNEAHTKDPSDQNGIRLMTGKVKLQDKTAYLQKYKNNLNKNKKIE